jgi:hypothetical protein
MTNHINDDVSALAAQRPRRRVAALLAAATPRAVATAALAAAPLLVALPVGAPSAAQHGSATLQAGECNTAVPFAGFNTTKWPDCAGD